MYHTMGKARMVFGFQSFFFYVELKTLDRGWARISR